MPARWRGDAAARISVWSSRPSRASGGSDREVARQPELAQMERGVPDALHQGVTAGDLVRRAPAPKRLRRHQTPGELPGARRGKGPPDFTRELLYGGGEGGGAGAGDGKPPPPAPPDPPAPPQTQPGPA